MAFVASCFLGALPGALPPVDLRAVCLVGDKVQRRPYFTPLVFRLELGKLEVALALASGGGVAAAANTVEGHLSSLGRTFFT